MRRLLIVFLVLLAVGLLAAAGGFLLAARDPGAALGGKVVLTWRLSGPLPDQPPLAPLPLPGWEAPASFASAFQALRAARTDPRVRGLAVVVDDPLFGLAKAQEIRDLLAALRGAGKFVDCYLETAGEGENGTLDYLIASACDTVGLAPSGEINLLGLYADSLFVRQTLDKLKIEPQFRHVGAYKSFAETFTESEHSANAEQALAAVLDSFFRQLVTAIAADREIEAAEVHRLIDDAPHLAAAAKDAVLVDSLLYPDEFRDAVEEKGAGARLVSLEDYRGGRGGPSAWRPGVPEIAVLFAQGTILRGESAIEPWTDEVFVGSRDFATAVRRLAEDDDVAAVVLRVDSPGGSALASDLMLRELVRLREKKPVVASFADVAASGGYYIAARANKIVAEPGTLTGSIGVVAGKFATRRFEHELLGLTHDTLQRGRNADYYASLDGFKPEQDETFRRSMLAVYDRFVDHVAAGRGMERPAVEAAAQGRVWTGEDAQRLGLIDELGGLERAIELARTEAGVSGPARLTFHPDAGGFFDRLLSRHAPALPANLRALLRLAAARPPGLLELGAESAGLVRPF